MIRFLENNQIDKVKWDNCIERSIQGLPYGFSWYLDIVTDNWAALVHNDYESVMPLPFKNKIGFKYIYQPFFTQQLGVFGEFSANFFLSKIPSNFYHININFNYLNKLENLGETTEHTNLIINLNKDHSKTTKLYSENCRRNIKKSLANNFHVKECSFKSILEIFQSTKGKNIPHLKKKNYETLIELLTELDSRKLLEIKGVYDKNENLNGGIILLNYKLRNIFFFSSVTKNGKNEGAMYFLLNTIIAEKSKNYSVFDFEGSNNQNLARFYNGFGAKEQNYFSYSINRLPTLLKIFKK